MGRGRGSSAGGGKSSLGYLFGGEEAANKPTTEPISKNPAPAVNEPSTKKASNNPDAEENEQTSRTSYTTNNYQRTDGQNCGNFITDRPSTKVHAAPGVGSSLDYLFGDGKK